MIVHHFLGDCWWLLVVMGDCGWLWVVMGDCGWLCGGDCASFPG